jgi:hypothetical protein
MYLPRRARMSPFGRRLQLTRRGVSAMLRHLRTSAASVTATSPAASSGRTTPWRNGSTLRFSPEGRAHAVFLAYGQAFFPVPSPSSAPFDVLITCRMTGCDSRIWQILSGVHRFISRYKNDGTALQLAQVVSDTFPSFRDERPVRGTPNSVSRSHPNSPSGDALES